MFGWRNLPSLRRSPPAIALLISLRHSRAATARAAAARLHAPALRPPRRALRCLHPRTRCSPCSVSPQVNAEKHLVVAQAGVVLSVLHDELARHGLAMRNLGSISDQTLGGVVTTATHGSGMHYPVLSMDVKALVLLLADGSRVRCSREENPDLFLASICGLGSTGLILEIILEVEPAFRLKEVQESHTFDDVVGDLDSIAHAAEHVRLWWFPHAGVIRVSSSNRTSEVCLTAPCFRALSRRRSRF